MKEKERTRADWDQRGAMDTRCIVIIRMDRGYHIVCITDGVVKRAPTHPSGRPYYGLLSRSFPYLYLFSLDSSTVSVDTGRILLYFYTSLVPSLPLAIGRDHGNHTAYVKLGS